jgi:hypothetical protein
MNTSDRHSFLETGVVLPNYIDYAPELRTVYLRLEDKLNAYAKSHMKLASSWNFNAYRTGNPTWSVLTTDSVKLHALLALNAAMLTTKAKLNEQQAAKVKAQEAEEQARKRATPPQGPILPQLSRTESRSVDEALQLMGQPRLVQTVITSTGQITFQKPAEQRIRAIIGHRPEVQQGQDVQMLDLTQQQPRPSTSRIVVQTGKEGTASNQEKQGNTTQHITLEEIRERGEALRVMESHKQANKRVTRAQLNKWTKDPKIKDQVLKHF